MRNIFKIGITVLVFSFSGLAAHADDESAVVGDWNLHYLWGAKDCANYNGQNPSGIVKQTFSPDGSYSNAQGFKGKWKQDEEGVEYMFGKGRVASAPLNHAIYKGDFIGETCNQMRGEMQAMNNGNPVGAGCWFATKIERSAGDKNDQQIPQVLPGESTQVPVDAAGN